MPTKNKTLVYAIEPNRVYSRAEAAELLNISLSTVKRMILAGQIPVSQPPEMRRIFILGQSLVPFAPDTPPAEFESVRAATDPAHYANRPLIEPNRVYSRLETATVLNISLSTVKRLIASGNLRASQPPGMRRVFITGQAILDFLLENIVEAANLTEDSDDEAALDG